MNAAHKPERTNRTETPQIRVSQSEVFSFVCPTNSRNPNTLIFTAINHKEKQPNLTIKRVEPANIWLFFPEKWLKQLINPLLTECRGKTICHFHYTVGDNLSSLPLGGKKRCIYWLSANEMSWKILAIGKDPPWFISTLSQRLNPVRAQHFEMSNQCIFQSVTSSFLKPAVYLDQQTGALLALNMIRPSSAAAGSEVSRWSCFASVSPILSISFSCVGTLASSSLKTKLRAEVSLWSENSKN